MGLRRKVDDVGRLVGGKDALYKIAILEIPVHKMVARVAPNGTLYILLVCTIVHSIHINKHLDAFGEIMIDEMTSYESISACHKEPHKCLEQRRNGLDGVERV